MFCEEVAGQGPLDIDIREEEMGERWDCGHAPGRRKYWQSKEGQSKSHIPESKQFCCATQVEHSTHIKMS